MSFYVICSSVSDHCEELWIKIKTNKCSIAIGEIYRPHRGNLVNFIDSLKISLRNTLPLTDQLISVGNIIIDLIKIDNVLNTTFQNLLQICDIYNKVTYFNQLIYSLFDRHEPIRTVRVSKPHPPWLTFPLKRMIQEKGVAFKKYWESQLAADWIYFKQLRNFTLSQIR